MKKRLLGILLSFALMMGMMPVLGVSQTAYAAETWSSDLTIDSSRTIDGGVEVTGDVTVTIAENATLTVNGGISAVGKTLTVEGKGNLKVTGSNGSEGDDSDPGSPGGTGGAGGNGIVVDDLIINGAEVIIDGGDGGNGGNGGEGGAGVEGTVTVNSGSITVNGGAGGDGGDGGNGGLGVEGTVTVSIGSATVTGGAGGSGEFGPGGSGSDGNNGIAASGALYGQTVQEKNNESDNWTVIASGNTSEKRYVKIEADGYPLWIGKTQVTGANKDNVLEGDPVNDGKVSYDPENNKLTLNGADISGENGNYTQDQAYRCSTIRTDLENLTIDVTSDSTVTGPGTGDWTYSYGILARECNLTITGEGELTASDSSNSYSTGVRAKKVVLNGRLAASGKTTNDSSIGDGVAVTENITINEGAELTAAGIGKRGIAISKAGESSTLINKIPGAGWTNAKGTEGHTNIAVNTTGQDLSSLENYKKVQFPEKVDKVTVTFDSAGGSAVAEQTIAKGAKATKPADPTRSGYTFDGWYLGDTAFDFSTAVNEDITLTAHWKKVPQSTITYDLNGGTLNGKTGTVTQTVDNGTVITLPEPTRDGYTFDYWEGSRYNAGDKYTVTGDHTFRAVWKTADNGGGKGGSSKGAKTGDDNTLGAWTLLLLGALTAATGMVYARKRKGE